MEGQIVPDDCDQPNVVHGLVRKRAELAGKIEHHKDVARQLTIELSHIDAAIHIFDQGVNLGLIPKKPMPHRHAALNGEVVRLVFDTLREADGPVTSKHIAHLMMAERGLDHRDHALSVIMVKRVCACLRVQRNKGLARNVPIAGKLQGWEIVK